MNDSEPIAAFLDSLRETSRQCKQAAADERLADEQTQDILHRLELYADDYHETARLAKLLRQVRQSRRKAKESFERLNPVSTWARENQAVVKRLEQLLGTVRKAEERQQKRLWMPRTEVLDKQNNSNSER